MEEKQQEEPQTLLDEVQSAPECLTGVVKFVLGAMLLDLPMHLVRNFWDEHPLRRGRDTLEGSQLLHHLWKDSEHVSLGYYLQVLNDLEPYLLRHGVSAMELVERNLVSLNSGSPLPPRQALKVLRQVLPVLLGTMDPRHACFDALPIGNEVIAPGTRLWSILGQDARAGWRRRWLILTHGSGYLRTMPAIDPQLWVLPMIRMFPVRLGLPALEEVECFGEMRRLEELLPPEELERKGGRWYSRGEEIAHEENLQVLCEARGFDALAEGLPDLPVQVATREWVCPIRKRAIVKPGHLYGTSAYLMQVGYRKLDLRSFPNMMGSLIDEALNDGGVAWKRANELFDQLVEDFGSTLRFVYHHQDESVTFNGSHILRNTPAKILQKVLMAYTVTGRDEFEHKEFRRDPDLMLDPNAPNLESRLKLLMDRLDNRCPALRIEKAGRGRFRLVVRGKVDFREQDF